MRWTAASADGGGRAALAVTRRGAWAAAIGLLTILSAHPSAAADKTSTPRALEALITAYPDHLLRAEKNSVVWKDGTQTRFDDGTGGKSFEERLANPDLEDMFYSPYAAGDRGLPPAFQADPGRARNTAFFDKMYGDCRRGEVEQHLTDVVWLPKHGGETLRVTKINGVADKLTQISAELDQLPAADLVFLHPSGGAYNCRAIAGTGRPSAHGHGIAVDIAVKPAQYWRWDKPGKDGRYAYRNAVPMKIVAVFEKYGFIWGGKWYHFDTMHFEYRPEILAAAD